jgi:hypothetical protein
MMRTTLTIDADVAIALERVRDTRELTLKAAVNEALRRGLRVMEAENERGARTPYRLRPWNSGGMRVSLDSVAEALAWGEGERWK